MRAFKMLLLHAFLLSVFTGCGLSLDVQKRVHRPGFYVNLSHDKERVKANKENVKEARTRRARAESSSLKKIDRTIPAAKEIYNDVTHPEKAPLVNESEDERAYVYLNKSTASKQFSGKSLQNFAFKESLPKRAEVSKAKKLEVPGSPFSFGGSILSLIFLVGIAAFIYYATSAAIFATLFTGNLEILAGYYVILFALILLYGITAGNLMPWGGGFSGGHHGFSGGGWGHGGYGGCSGGWGIKQFDIYG